MLRLGARNQDQHQSSWLNRRSDFHQTGRRIQTSALAEMPHEQPRQPFHFGGLESVPAGTGTVQSAGFSLAPTKPRRSRIGQAIGFRTEYAKGTTDVWCRSKRLSPTGLAHANPASSRAQRPSSNSVDRNWATSPNLAGAFDPNGLSSNSRRESSTSLRCITATRFDANRPDVQTARGSEPSDVQLR